MPFTWTCLYAAKNKLIDIDSDFYGVWLFFCMVFDSAFLTAIFTIRWCLTTVDRPETRPTPSTTRRDPLSPRPSPESVVATARPNPSPSMS